MKNRNRNRKINENKRKIKNDAAKIRHQFIEKRKKKRKTEKYCTRPVQNKQTNKTSMDDFLVFF